MANMNICMAADEFITELHRLGVHAKVEFRTQTLGSNKYAHGDQQHSTTPNPSLKRSPNGTPPGPGHRYGVHFLWPGPGVMPQGPA